MENPRTTSARDHDDKDLIDNAEAGGGVVGRAGGALATDVGTQDELAEVAEPDGQTRANKRDDQAAGVAARSDRVRGG